MNTAVNECFSLCPGPESVLATRRIQQEENDISHLLLGGKRSEAAGDGAAPRSAFGAGGAAVVN
jgi:hypothetical protein